MRSASTVAAMRIRGVLFDFGSTLFGHAPLPATITAAGAAIGHDIDAAIATELATRIDALAADPAEVARGRDLDRAVWAARWPVLYATADDRYPGLGAAVDAAMHDPQAWVPYAATARVLAELAARGVRVGVLSNTGWEVRDAFAVRGLDRYVDAFTLSCDVGVAKPDPRIFAAACAAIGVAPAEALMVGDDARADVGGVALGIRTVLLPAVEPGDDNGLTAVVGAVDATDDHHLRHGAPTPSALPDGATG